MTFPDQERAHISAMWAAHHEGEFQTAALEALEAGDCIGTRTVEGAAVFAAQAQVYATLAVAEQQRIANLIALGDSTSDDSPLVEARFELGYRS